MEPARSCQIFLFEDEPGETHSVGRLDVIGDSLARGQIAYGLTGQSQDG